MLLLVIVGTFICTGYMTGSDWRTYELWYSSFDNVSVISNFEKEKGFALLMYFGNWLGLDFWIFWIIIKIVCLYIIINKLSLYTKKRYGWGLLYFFAYFSIFYFIDNPMRNLISATLFIFAYKYLITKNFIKYIGIVFFCSFIHSSVLFFIPLYFLFKAKINLSNKQILFVCLCFYLLLVMFWVTGLRDVVNNFMINFGGAEYRGYGYLYETTNIISFGFIVVYTLFGFILYKREYIISTTKYGEFLILLSFVYVLTYTLGFFIPIMSRLSMFCYIPFISAFSISMLNVNRFRYNVIGIYVTLFLLVIMMKNITRDYRYIPYSSYLQYLFEDKPNYNTRSLYNPNNSPYKSDNFIY